MTVATQTVIRLRPGPTNQLGPGPHDHLTRALAVLHASCIERDHTVADFLPPLNIPVMTRWWQTRIDEIASGNREIIAIVENPDDEGRAFVAAVVMLSFPLLQTGPMRGMVQKLLVSPDRRRQGLAKRVMTELERVALERGKWYLTLDTEVGSPAELVYPRLGWEAAGVIPDCEISPKDGSLISSRWFWKNLQKSTLVEE